jgi:ankyrin repeat protein
MATTTARRPRLWLVCLGVIANLVAARAAEPATALIEAAREGDTAALEALLAAGTDPDSRSKTGWTPLMAAILAEADGDARTPVVRALLHAGADPNARYIGPELRADTPVLLAAEHGFPVTLQALLRWGGDLAVRNAAGLSPLMIVAAARPPHHVTKFMDDLTGCWEGDDSYTEKAKLLLADGAAVNARDPRGRTPLALARARPLRTPGDGRCQARMIAVLEAAGGTE